MTEEEFINRMFELDPMMPKDRNRLDQIVEHFETCVAEMNRLEDLEDWKDEFELTEGERKNITDHLDEIAALATKFKYDTMEKKCLQAIIEDQQKEINKLLGQLSSGPTRDNDFIWLDNEGGVHFEKGGIDND